MLRLNKTKILLFVVAYMLFVTLTTIYYDIVFFAEYLTAYNLGFVLTKAGVSIITPLMPLSRLILGILGLTGAIFLLAGRRKGLWISTCWAVLQIPSFTLSFGKATQNVLMGLASLNLQRFFAGTFYSHSRLYKSAFTKTTSALTKGIGVNFVGVIIFFLLMVIWLQNNEKALTYLKITSNKLYSKIFAAFQSALVITLIGVASGLTIQNYLEKPNLKIKVVDANCPININFVGYNDKVKTVMADFDVILKNIGKSPTTVENVYLDLRIFPLVWMPDTPTYGMYYPGGSHEGMVSGLMQKKLWNLIPNDLKKNEFNNFRIKAEDEISKHFSFIIPISEIIDEEHYSIFLKGKLVVETVGGKIFKSEDFVFNRRGNRRGYPKKEIFVKNWSELYFERSSQLFDRGKVQQVHDNSGNSGTDHDK